MGEGKEGNSVKEDIIRIYGNQKRLGLFLFRLICLSLFSPFILLALLSAFPELNALVPNALFQSLLGLGFCVAAMSLIVGVIFCSRCPSCSGGLTGKHGPILNKFCPICGGKFEVSDDLLPWNRIYTCNNGHKLRIMFRKTELNYCSHCGVQLRKIGEETGNKVIPPVIEPEVNLDKQSEAPPVTQPSVDTSTLAIGNQTEPETETRIDPDQVVCCVRCQRQLLQSKADALNGECYCRPHYLEARGMSRPEIALPVKGSGIYGKCSNNFETRGW